MASLTREGTLEALWTLTQAGLTLVVIRETGEDYQVKPLDPSMWQRGEDEIRHPVVSFTGDHDEGRMSRFQLRRGSVVISQESFVSPVPNMINKGDRILITPVLK